MDLDGEQNEEQIQIKNTEQILFDAEVDNTIDNTQKQIRKKKKTKKVKKQTVSEIDEIQILEQKDKISQSLILDKNENDFMNETSGQIPQLKEHLLQDKKERDNKKISDSASDHSIGSDSSGSSLSSARFSDKYQSFKFFMHVILLLKKTLLTFARNKFPILVTVFCPVLWHLCIYYLNSTEKIMQDGQNELAKVGAVHQLQQIEECYGDNCITIGYSIIGDPNHLEQFVWIDDIMKQVAFKNSLEFNKGVRRQTVGNVQNFFNYIEANPNSTKYSVVWCTDEYTIDVQNNLALPCRFGGESSGKEMIFYTLWYNKSLQDTDLFKPTYMPVPKNPELIYLQESIDNSILSYLHDRYKKDDLEKAPQIHSTYSDFPEPLDRMFKNMDLMSLCGTYYFVLGPLVLFMVLLQEIVKEKEFKLRQGLTVVGISHNAYWAHWIIIGTSLNILQNTTQLICGYIFNFTLWQNCPSQILFEVFFSYGQSMVFISFLVSTMVDKLEKANILSYSIILFMVLIEMFFSNAFMCIRLFYSEKMRDLILPMVVSFFCEFVPTFSFSMAFGLIANIASKNWDDDTASWVDGQKYTKQMYHQKLDVEIKVSGEKLHAESPFYFVSKMYQSMIIAAFLFWYFDHIITSNRGVSYSFFFPFQKSYWISVFPLLQKNQQIKLSKKEKNQLKIKKIEKVLGIGVKQEDTFNSVEIEEKRVIEDEKNEVFADGLRVVGIKKVYHRSLFGFKSNKDVHAVSGIYLEVSQNELLCLLGHNGAGKSTLFNMLTGIIGPSEGHAKIAGLDIRTDQEKIRKIMGVVPQFDILWNQMTAMEHMYMFSRIKGVQSDMIEDESIQLLKKVGLEDVKNAQVASFSGGMKRRLSVAISVIGNPKIIFLDEPTTGMDPVSRRDVWALIQDLKRDKTIILTTHAMEEADALADRIAVVVDGKLKCIGTPLNLKNTYGEGYIINMICDYNDQQEIIDLMNQIAPSNKLIDESGGSMMFSVPIENQKEIAPLFRLIEQKKNEDDIQRQNSQSSSEGLSNFFQNQKSQNYEYDSNIDKLKQLVSDCGISHSTLEQVFMKVTGKKKAASILKQEKLNQSIH